MKIKIKKILSVTMAAAFIQAAQASEPAADFDRGFDTQSAMENFYTGVAESEPSFVYVTNGLKATTDCEIFAFKAGDPGVSPTSVLRSRVTQTVCKDEAGEQKCHDEFLRKVKRNVSVALEGDAEFLPGEKDVFRVCLKDTRISVEVLEAVHQYEIGEKAGPENDYQVRAVIVKKAKNGEAAPTTASAGRLMMPEKAGNLKATVASAYSDILERAPELRGPLELGLKYLLGAGFRQRGSFTE